MVADSMQTHGNIMGFVFGCQQDLYDLLSLDCFVDREDGRRC